MTDFAAMPDDRLLAVDDGLHTMFAKAIALDADTTPVLLAHEDLADEMRKRSLIYEPLAKSDHAFVPVRNICRNCRKHGSEHGEADHDLVPVRNICRNCGQGTEVHKAVEYELTDIEKALPDSSVEQRKQWAETGIAMPDGSFPIPDEAHLHAAIRLVGQAQDPQSAMNHIIERAKAMGMEDALPPAWQQTTDPSAPGAPAIGDGAHSLPAGKPQPAAAAATKPGFGGGGAGAGAGVGAAAGGGSPSPAGAGAGAPDPDLPKPGAGMMKRLAKALGEVMGASFDQGAFVKELSVNLDPEFQYAMLKANTEQRYTLGPVYMPDTMDAHGEWATAEDLEKAIFAYVKSTGGDRDIFLQHSDKRAGRWVSIMPWPQEVHATMTKSIDGVAKAQHTTFPAGTVWMGVEWDPWAFDMVKAGDITGFSMGGFSRRLEGSPA